MEVSKGQSSITHAVISSEVATSFSLADNSALMDLLSTSVYKNQLLAAIREPLANAWDAHIDANITNTPIKVTIDDTHIIIRDFGKGIPDNRMFQVYTVYGLSLKTQDEKATGGFGVGSKAPFAYSDLFEVITRNNGIQSLYIFSKSSAQNDGKPSGIKVYSIPTTEQGLEVRIPYKTQDLYTIKEYFKALAYYGEIFVSLKVKEDESILDMMEYSKIVPYNLLTQYTNTVILSSSRNPISIRYGALVYPLEDNPHYQEEFATLKRLLEKTLFIRGQSLIIKAEPNTLAVAFSRETLAYKSSTLATIKDLLTKAIEYLKTTYETLSDTFDKYTQEETDRFLKELDNPTKEAEYFPSWPKALRIDPDEFASTLRKALQFKYQTLNTGDTQSDLTRRICQVCFDMIPLDKIFYSRVVPKMVRNLPHALHANSHIAKIIRKNITPKSLDKYNTSLINTWTSQDIYKEVIRHLHRIVDKSPLLNIHNFYTLGSNSYWAYHLSAYSKKIIYKNSLDGNALFPISYNRIHQSLLSKLLQGFIKIHILSSSNDINNRESPPISTKRSDLFYRVTSTKLVDKIAEVEAFKAAISSLKFPFEITINELVDLTPKERVVKPKKPSEPTKPTSTRRPVTKREYPKLINGYNSPLVNWKDPNLLTLASPEYIYYQSEEHRHLQFLTSDISAYGGDFAKEFLARKFGDNTAIITNKLTYKALLNAGFKPLTANIFAEALYEVLLQNDDFIKAMAYRKFRRESNQTFIDFDTINQLLQVKEIQDIVGVLKDYSPVSSYEVESVFVNPELFTTDQRNAIDEKAQAFISKSKDFKIISKFLNNKYLTYVETHKSRMHNNGYAPEQIKLITTVLKFRG